MEMESGSRRSIDRSRETGGPGLKKPRLADELASNGVVFDRNQPRVPPATGAVAPRFRGNERERERQQQPQQPPQQNNQELVSQYKTALAELTFNSKPIITNLTIIAGENLHAAKWIAATVCANIIEVPSDQKLPSLYLLDSIVKNIGRDYIKYFAARLPEVFSKAYRQVDSSIHSGMRHLFGTWKGVFPLNCLQTIEKELGIAPASNGSSSGATPSRPESQSHRPPNSIHVNPKYLEARRFQQSIKVKGGNASTVPIVSSAEDAERPDQAGIGSERAWPDLPMKSHDFKHPQREASETVLEKNIAEYEDSEYNSDLPGYSNLGYGRTSEKVTERDKRDKPWYGVEKTAAESMVSKGNAFDTQHGLAKYRTSRPALPTDPRVPMGSVQRNASSGRGMNKNWKNSEEEEYMWDDMNSRLTDRGIRDRLRKDVWTPDDAEKQDFDDHLSQPHGELDAGTRISRESSIDSISIAQRGQTAFGNLTPSMWPLQETSARDGLKHTGVTSRISGLPESHPTSVSGSTLARTGLQNQTGSSSTGAPSFGSLGNTSSGILGQQRHQPSSMIHRPQSPTAFPQHHESHNLIEEDHLPAQSIPQFGSKLSNSVPQLNRTPPRETSHNSFPMLSQNHIQSGSLQNFHLQSSQHLPTSSSLMQFPQRRPHSPFSLQPFPELTPSQHSGIIQKPVPQSSSFGAPPVISHSVSSYTANSAADIPGQSSTSSLLAAIAKSGLLSNNSVSDGLPDQKFQESQVHNHPPLPSGLPPLLPTSSTSMATPASVLDSASTQSLTNLHKTSALPPLPPGPPPPSSATGTSTSNVANAAANPLSGLLSSLVAKGLISTPAKESPTPPAAQVSSLLKNQSTGLTTSSSTPVSSRSAPSATPKTSFRIECPLPESAAKSTAATCSPATKGETETKDLIGIVFKPEIIRKSHPSVISGLFEDLPHQCNICAFRVKLKEQLDQHFEWHASRKAELTNCGTVSRRWYASSGDWVTGSVNFSSGSISTSAALIETLEQNEPSVPADENQCICLLCGEPFEDFYSRERDEWMFKGTVYMPIPAVVSGIQATDIGTLQGPIVHAKCISPSSVEDLGLIKSVKQELMDE